MMNNEKWIVNNTKRKSHRQKPTGFSFWRRQRDSNPRALAGKRFSRPPRCDRFDNPPYVEYKLSHGYTCYVATWKLITIRTYTHLFTNCRLLIFKHLWFVCFPFTATIVTPESICKFIWAVGDDLYPVSNDFHCFSSESSLLCFCTPIIARRNGTVK